MKVLLIKPPTGNIYKNMEDITPEYPPLGLAYIAAVLEKNNHEVKILDLSIDKLNLQQLTKFIENYQPKIIGFTATTPTITIVYSLIKELKSQFKNITFVIGGPHATALPEESLQFADIVVKGEGELTFLDITNKHSLSKITGISYKKNNKFYHNPSRPLIQDLDSLPFPARHLLKMEKYHYFGARQHPLTNIFTSRGCPYQCTYCNKNIFGTSFRIRSIKNIMKEIELLVSDFGIKEIHISDDTFTLNKKQVHEFCKEAKQYNLSFYPHNGFRVNCIDREMLQDMKSAGFYSMVYGVESGDQTILNNIKKGFTLEQVETAFKLTKEIGFETWAFFILGLPGETIETAKKTINFAIKLNPDIAKFHILVPYPGTEVYEQFKNRMLIKDWSDFSIFSGPTFIPENMTSDELEKLFRVAYIKFYLRPSPILKTIKRNIQHPSLLKETFKASLALINLTKK